MPDSQRESSTKFINYVRHNYESVKHTLESDNLFLRNYAAENGVEWTPDEIKNLKKLLVTALDIIDNRMYD